MKTCENCGEQFSVLVDGMNVMGGDFDSCWICSHACRQELIGSQLYISDSQLRRIEHQQMGQME